MTGPAPRPGQGGEDSAGDSAEDRADWIRDLDTALSARGLATRLSKTAEGLDLTAATRPPGHKPAEVIADEDGYLELRWWSDPAATPQQVAAVITSALAAVTPAGTGSSRS